MATLGQWLLLTPLWLIFVILFGGLIAFAQIGILFRRWMPPDTTVNGGKADPSDLVLSSVMGLLALLVGFTFSLAIDRYDTRRANVAAEANAIGTTYLRTQLIEEPHRTRLNRLLMDYTDNRVALANSGPGAGTDALLQKNDELLTDLWTATVAAFPSIRPYDFSNGYLETMNAVIDMDTLRKAGRLAHVPPAVFALLFLYQYVTAAVFGYLMVGRHGRLVSAFLLSLFALSVIFVIDIDRPIGGAVRESQAPMLWLQTSMHANPAAIYDRFNAQPPAQADSR